MSAVRGGRAPPERASGGTALVQLAGGRLNVILQAHLVDESQLFFDEVDMLFLACLDVEQELASDEVPNRFAVLDSGVVQWMRGHLQLQIAEQYLFHVLADEQLAEVLQVRQSFEEKDAFDQAVRMLHFIDRLLVLDLAEALHPPVIEHAGMQEVLIDGG